METAEVPVVLDEGFRHLGALIRSQREASGWTMEGLAEEISTKTNVIANRSKIARLEKPIPGSKPDTELLMAVAAIGLLKHPNDKPFDFMDLWNVAAGRLVPDLPK